MKSNEHINTLFFFNINTAPYKDVKEAVRRGKLAPLNPTPWAVMTGCTTGWVTYSYLINNLFLFFTNAPGLILSVWLNMAAAKLQYSDRIAKNMRASFVDLLESNRESFRMPQLRETDESEEDNEDGDKNGTNTTIVNTSNDVDSFANLKQMALDITIQKAEAPAPHEMIVVAVVYSGYLSFHYFTFFN